jgi:hypothetical protein
MICNNYYARVLFASFKGPIDEVPAHMIGHSMLKIVWIFYHVYGIEPTPWSRVCLEILTCMEPES